MSIEISGIHYFEIDPSDHSWRAIDHDGQEVDSGGPEKNRHDAARTIVKRYPDAHIHQVERMCRLMHDERETVYHKPGGEDV